MNDQLDKVVNEYGQRMVNVTAGIIAADAKSIIMGEQQLVDPEKEGSPLQAVIPQEKFRIEQQRRMGGNRPYPSKPRYNTGLMMRGIVAEFGTLTASAGVEGVSDGVAEGQQFGNSGYTMFGWTSPAIPARPFMGVSDRALERATQQCEKLAGQMIAALDSAETITTTMSV